MDDFDKLVVIITVGLVLFFALIFVLSRSIDQGYCAILDGSVVEHSFSWLRGCYAVLNGQSVLVGSVETALDLLLLTRGY